MPLVQNLLQGVIFVLLVRHTHLMLSRDLIDSGLSPFACTNEMLCLDARVTEEVRARDHSQELLSRHSFEKLADDASVVNLQAEYGQLIDCDGSEVV
jgi:hypothetical protein